MREKAHYFSFWNWFNSLTVTISSCILFPGKSIALFFLCLPGRFWLDASHCKCFLFAYYVLLDSDKCLQLCSRITAKPLGNHLLSLETDSRLMAFWFSKIIVVLLPGFGCLTRVFHSGEESNLLQQSQASECLHLKWKSIISFQAVFFSGIVFFFFSHLDL